MKAIRFFNIKAKVTPRDPNTSKVPDEANNSAIEASKKPLVSLPETFKKPTTRPKTIKINPA